MYLAFSIKIQFVNLSFSSSSSSLSLMWFIFEAIFSSSQSVIFWGLPSPSMTYNSVNMAQDNISFNTDIFTHFSWWRIECPFMIDFSLSWVDKLWQCLFFENNELKLNFSMKKWITRKGETADHCNKMIRCMLW